MIRRFYIYSQAALLVFLLLSCNESEEEAKKDLIKRLANVSLVSENTMTKAYLLDEAFQISLDLCWEELSTSKHWYLRDTCNNLHISLFINEAPGLRGSDVRFVNKFSYNTTMQALNRGEIKVIENTISLDGKFSTLDYLIYEADSLTLCREQYHLMESGKVIKMNLYSQPLGSLDTLLFFNRIESLLIEEL